MYKAILKEIGAEESYMEYLFEESDEDNLSDNNNEGDESHVFGDYAMMETAMKQLEGQTSVKDALSDDGNLLNQWESEAENSSIIDDPNKMKREEDNVHISASTQSSDDRNTSYESLPTWKQMLQVNSAKQEQILGQMISLQNAQKESSPRNKIKRLMMNSGEALKEETIVLKEISDNDPNTNSSLVSSNTVQQISTRNAKLQGQWRSQQEKSTELQDKLTVMQTEFYNQQLQWEKEQQDLFSPAKSPTKIPKWRLSAMSPNGSAARATTSDKIVISPKTSNNISSENTSSEELELSKALILQLEAKLDNSQKMQQLQQDELRDCKDRLKKRDIEHKAFLLRYETEKKSWQDESKENQAQFYQELQSRDADLEATRQELQQHIVINQNLREKHHNELKQFTLPNEMKSEMEENQKQSAYIQELEEENHRLKTDFMRKTELERTQEAIKLQMKMAIEDQTKKTREFQSRIRELEGRHAEELEYWEAEVDDRRRQNELNSTRMESQLEEANARFANLERKHDKEIKEWQNLLDADITKAVADESGFEDDESQSNLMVIGADGTGAESLSPIRMMPQQNAENASNEGTQKLPNESMNMIDDLLNELGEMDLERTAILKEIKSDDDSTSIDNVHIGDELDDSFEKRNSSSASGPKTDRETDKGNNEPPKPIEPPDNAWNDAGRENADASDATNESEVLDETLHLLNNLKTMLSSQENVNEHETTVIERLEVLSELMQSQDHSNSGPTSGIPSMLETHNGHNVSSSSAVNETSLAMLAVERNTKDVSWVSTIGVENPWAALVTELKSRCEFLERDRDEVTRITEQILQMERASYKVELEAAVAAVERKANENLHKIQLESNREMNVFYQNICFQCHEEAFDYSDGKEDIDE